eukprot:CAMPEP_0117462008 /NCGR_PEP_ID=MMETSP0784-20121206/2829_1 /TAXON_ID=39447 /ORGANISM="" /LENGTH=179 /DNA_ID=CAMNT_0005255753 /DNA_START=44 /DNA_END=583 /DNA_ORIENTATION=-
MNDGSSSDSSTDGNILLPTLNDPNNNNSNNDNNIGIKRKRKSAPDLDPYMKWALIVRTIQESKKKRNQDKLRLKNGALDMLSQEFGISKRSVQRIYGDYRTQIENGVLVPDMTSKKANRCGAVSKLTEEVANNIKALREKLSGKVTARGLAEAYEREYGDKLPYMTLYRYDRILSGVIQ